MKMEPFVFENGTFMFSNVCVLALQTSPLQGNLVKFHFSWSRQRSPTEPKTLVSEPPTSRDYISRNAWSIYGPWRLSSNRKMVLDRA